MAISFKSVGKTSKKTRDEQNVVSATETPIGIVTPLRLGNRSEGILKMSTSLSDVVSDNLRNLISTNWGERLGKHKFGANLREITTEIVSQEDFDNEAMARIKLAVEKWMPYVNLIDFSSDIDSELKTSTGKIALTVTFIVPGVQDSPRSLRVDLYII